MTGDARGGGTMSVVEKRVNVNMIKKRTMSVVEKRVNVNMIEFFFPL